MPTVIVLQVAFEESFWLEKSEVAKKFFQQVILPEALGKHFTKEKISESEIQDNEQDEWEVFSDVDIYEEVVLLNLVLVNYHYFAFSKKKMTM